MYPAAYNWVLGVMARRQVPNAAGDYLAGFSNFDCTIRDTHEYELMAPGIDVWSTLPADQYAAWDGTSMSTPVVSGIAALVRTKFADKDVYSSRFIMGQIATTGPLMQAYTLPQGLSISYYAPDADASLNTSPKPELTYLEHWLFDTETQSTNNDNDGIVDAGETVELAIVIRNHWGKADPVTVLLEPWAEGATGPDPYVTMEVDTVNYGAVGSFNQDDNGLLYGSDGLISGVQHPFRFSVNPDAPNDHVIPFRLTLTAQNGLDLNDETIYVFNSRFYLVVQRGRQLPSIITDDMLLTSENLWLVQEPVLIEASTHVTVTTGTQVQFGTSDNDVYLQVEGSLAVSGTAESAVEMFGSALNPERRVAILNYGNSTMKYVRITNPQVGFSWTPELPNRSGSPKRHRSCIFHDRPADGP